MSLSQSRAPEQGTGTHLYDNEVRREHASNFHHGGWDQPRLLLLVLTPVLQINTDFGDRNQGYWCFVANSPRNPHSLNLARTTLNAVFSSLQKNLKQFVRLNAAILT